MSNPNKFTLDSIRESAHAKYGSTDIDLGDTVCKLLSPLRLTKENRKALMALQKDMENEGDDADTDQGDQLSESIRLIAETPAQAEALLEKIDGDLSVLAEVFERYGKATQMGEASPSAA